jgi:transposase-like protein
LNARAHRIREAMTMNNPGLMGGKGRTVEADKTYWGNTKRTVGKGRGYAHKMKVVALVEREGKLRSFHVSDVKASTVKQVLVDNVIALLIS